MRRLLAAYGRIVALVGAGALLLAAAALFSGAGARQTGAERAAGLLQRDIYRQEAAMRAALNDSAALFAALEQPALAERYVDRFAEQPFEILLYRDGELLIWTDNEVMPENINRIFRGTYHFTRFSNGYYEVLRRDYPGRVTALALANLYHTYPVANQYLRDGFRLRHPLLENVRIATSGEGIPVYAGDGTVLFGLVPNEDGSPRVPAWLLWMQAAGLVLILAGGFGASSLLFRREYPVAGTVALALTLAVALGLHYSDALLYMQHARLFSPRIFAASAMLPSLGHLLVLSLAVFAAAAFAGRYLRTGPHRPGNIAKAWAGAAGFLLFAAVFWTALRVICSVTEHSTISFDFYNFFSLSVYSVAGIGVFSLWFAVLYVAGSRAAMAIRSWSARRVVILVAVCAAALWAAGGWLPEMPPLWVAFYFLLLTAYFLVTDRRQRKFNFLNALIISAIFATITAHVITRHIASMTFDRQQDFISELLFERDLAEEFNLLEISGDIPEDNFVRQSFKHPFLNEYNLEKRLRTKYFGELNDRYNLFFYAFNAQGMPLAGELDKDFDALQALFLDERAEAVSENIRYYSGRRENLKYLLNYRIGMPGEALGHLYVEVVPKIFSASSAYPELLLSGEEGGNLREADYEYAIYENGTLQRSRGDYEYTSSLVFDAGDPGTYHVYHDKHYDHLVFTYSRETVVVLSSRQRPIISPFSAFSYTFCILLLVLVGLWASGLRQYLLPGGQLPPESQPVTLQRRIQVAMISLVLSSLFIIGVITLVYFQNQYNTYHNARLLRKAEAMAEHLQIAVMRETPDTVAGPAEFARVLEHDVQDMADVHALDLNVFRPDGRLLTSSQPDVFNKGLISGLMHPAALTSLQNKGKSRHVQRESIGGLRYFSAYMPFRNQQGELLGYLHFPYYDKQQSFRSDISFFLVALVNVYVLLILTATAISLVLSRTITNSLTLIKDRLSGLQLREKNQPIEWKNQDEIGLLVTEYNRMIRELEKSAELLAKSEREAAWREMARQVAHEIKNPLTPMKLSIQHLQRALREGRSDVQELTEQVAARLIEQIDNLSHIASEFSSFATMPAAQLERIDLREVVESTASLFRHLQHIDVTVDMPGHPCYILADKNQMIGVFNNLLKNASQAISEESGGVIAVRLLEKPDVYRVEIEDNGVGIPGEKQARVFEPNFTTKSSGTGLGLAISRNIIEKSKGNIWFESTEGQGTTFFIVLPKLESEDQPA